MKAKKLLPFLMLLTATTVIAQPWPHMPKLDKSDLDLMGKNTLELLENGKIGDTKAWENEKTGTKGSIKLIARQNKGERPCGEVSQDIEPAREKAARNLRIWRCKQEDSSWKIESPNS